MATKNWADVAARKRQLQADAISAFIAAELPDADKQKEYYESITHIDDIPYLAKDIGQGKYSSEDVTKAYIAQ